MPCTFPVEVAEVGIVHLHIGEELTKCGNDGLHLLCIEEGVVECAHCFAMFIGFCYVVFFD